jgi:hypothetical protein
MGLMRLFQHNLSLFKPIILVMGLFYLPMALGEAEHEFSGKAALITSYSDGIQTADMSRLEGDDSFDLSGQLQLSYDYSNDNFGFFSHLQFTNEGNSKDGNIGIAEMYGYYSYPIDDSQQLTFTMGQLFMPSSFENTEGFWDSPYSNSFSALNTWIAQEVRPIGVELKYDWLSEDETSAFGLGVMSFVGNDSMGAMVSWKGWSIGRHISVYGEVLNLPEIYHIDNGIFADQRVDGSKPFGRDLDHKEGYLFHSYYSPTNSLTFKYTHLDNKGDGQLYRGEYAWRTTFSIVGVKWRINDKWTVLGESMSGRTMMGNPSVMGVASKYKTTYVLTSYNHKQWDFSVRLEEFDIVDTARAPRESNDQGSAVTLGARWQAFGKPWSVLGELLFIDVDGHRTRALDIGTFTDENESQWSLSVNYFF